MVSKGQFVGLDWNRIARLHSQVMTGTQELTNSIRRAVTLKHIKMQPTNLQSKYIKDETTTFFFSEFSLHLISCCCCFIFKIFLAG